LVLDSSGLLAFVNRADPNHALVRNVVLQERGDLLVPAGIMAEIAYLIETRLGQKALELFLLDLESGSLTLDCGLKDLSRIRELTGKYADLPLGFADAAVIVCAERTSRRVLGLDRRHFWVVAREIPFVLLPEQL
jgi:uncharacterized protein